MQSVLEIHNRRAFCKHVASTAAWTAGLAALLQGCGGNPSSSIPGSALPILNGTPGAAGVTVTIAASSPLASTGGMALVTSTVGNFLVTRTAANAFVALTANCTHEACVVSSFTGQTFVCPCHGSEFDTSGRVVLGPASIPLRQFQTQFANDVLTIS
jgi:cytochrome b6-f complex iron-sulfur subunit